MENKIIQLANLVHLSHYNATLNNESNISRVAVLVAYQGSRNINQAIAAGILSMGGQHAPLVEARALIREYKKLGKEEFYKKLEFLMRQRMKVPGYGNSFYKDRIDPSFWEVYVKYNEVSEGNNTIDDITECVNDVFKKIGKKVFLYPNAAIITAAVAEIGNYAPGTEVSMALQGRIPAWIKLMAEFKD